MFKLSLEILATLPLMWAGLLATIHRKVIFTGPTPQTFQLALIKRAFKQDYQDSFTDDASVVNAMQEPVYLIEGERYNIKITTPEDLIIAEALLNHEE